MSEHVVREALRQLWIPEYSDVPFRQTDGSHELTDAGLKVYFTGREYDEEYFHALCGLAPQLERIATHRLCGVSKTALLALTAWLVIAVALLFLL